MPEKRVQQVGINLSRKLMIGIKDLQGVSGLPESNMLVIIVTRNGQQSMDKGAIG